MNNEQQLYNARVIGEFQREIATLIQSLPESAHIHLPPGENDLGKRVSFQRYPEIGILSWEVDSPRAAGPLSGSGEVFGDQLFALGTSPADSISYRATIRARDGVIISWEGPPSTSDQTSIAGWALSLLSSFFPTICSRSYPQSFSTPSPNDYSRATSVLKDLAVPEIPGE